MSKLEERLKDGLELLAVMEQECIRRGYTCKHFEYEDSVVTGVVTNTEGISAYFGSVIDKVGVRPRSILDKLEEYL